jgi:hypothetical protein
MEELGLIGMECMQGVKIPAGEKATMACKVDENDLYYTVKPQFGNSFYF